MEGECMTVLAGQPEVMWFPELALVLLGIALLLLAVVLDGHPDVM